MLNIRKGAFTRRTDVPGAFYRLRSKNKQQRSIYAEKTFGGKSNPE
ncbi:hypothetical protein NUITMVRA1_19570 [Aerococcus viridans]|nr:hypothetical protein [Vagococcus fluvialis]GMR71278.1 hypothetical protein NUITMVRA1_19570 [Aerococcus viridans]